MTDLRFDLAETVIHEIDMRPSVPSEVNLRDHLWRITNRFCTHYDRVGVKTQHDLLCDPNNFAPTISE